MPRNRRRPAHGDLAGLTSPACSAGHTRSRNSQRALRPIRHATCATSRYSQGVAVAPFGGLGNPEAPPRGAVLSAPAEAGAAPPLAERSMVATPRGSDASTLSSGGWPKNCQSKERLQELRRSVGAPALGPPRGYWVGSAARGHGGKGVGGLRAAPRRGWPAAPSPHPRRPCW